MAQSVTETIWITSEEEIQQMMAMWPDIVCDIMKETENSNYPDIAKWMEKVLEYNVRGGKKTIALELIYAYKLLAPSDQLTEENIRLVRILAWCTELLQAYFLILDDMQDRTLFRRGQPCWYRHNDIGLAAIHDAVMIQNVMFHLIRKHFKGKDYYVNLLETFHDIILKTIMGQSLDLLSTNFGKKPNLDLFTMNRYIRVQNVILLIVEYKTSYYSFVLPVITAMQLVGIKDPEMFRQAKTILLEMGHLYQVQDDYLDCYGDLNIQGKDSTKGEKMYMVDCCSSSTCHSGTA